MRIISHLFKKYSLRTVFFIFILFVSLNAKAQNQFQPDNQYIETLIDQALKMDLHKTNEWLILLHYKSGLFGIRSLVDDPRFFLDENGKNDPKKELVATIRSFFKPIENNKMHAGLKFIARFHWLKTKLQFDISKLPADFDAEFDAYYKKLEINKAILVFPAGYINSPASMYGHTLLVFENNKGNRLLSYAVNYAAKTEESFGPTFAIKGLFGLYDGFYSLLRYSDKINEYSSGEMRDMWEYTLNLNAEEIKQTFRHVVEMDNIASRYYFVDENCSYNILFLIDAARPSLNLTDNFYFMTEPIDTIRIILKLGLVEKKEYRPSLYTQILTKSKLLKSNETSAVIYFINNEDTLDRLKKEISPENLGLSLDLAGDYLKFLLSKDKIDLETYQKKIFMILKARSAEPTGKPVYYEPPIPPDQSHLSSKLSLTGGAFQENPFIQLTWRPTCHNLIDSNIGLSKNSEIIFFTPTFRYYPNDKLFEFHSIDFLKITSLPSSTKYFTPGSFLVHSGLLKTPAPNKMETFGGFFNFAGGFNFELIDHFYFFILAYSDTRFSSAYKTGTLASIGPKAGIILDITDYSKTIATGEYLINPYGEKTKIFQFSADERISFGSRIQLVLNYTSQWIFKKRYYEYSGRFEFFY